MTSALALSPGTRLGPYEITAPIAAGGMGDVYRARDTRLDRVVAIKISRDAFSDRFEREARAVASLNHPHICTLHDVGPNYLVMEYVEGTPLVGPLPLEQAMTYAAQICDALDVAHRRGVTHRDLKPANILIAKTGVKLLDFGLAKVEAAVVSADGVTAIGALTQHGQILGTLHYMSPEQLQGREAGATSDIFAFGLVLYEMLTGSRAFDGSSPASVIAAILERPAPSLATLAPPALDRVLQRCLEKDPENRWQSARDLKAAMALALERLPEQTARQGATSFNRGSLVAAIAAALAMFGAGWALSGLGQPAVAPDDRVIRFHIDPPEGSRFVSLGTNSGGTAISPDGRTVAYVASTNGRPSLWLHPLDGAPRMVAASEGASRPFWSPDSASIGFFTRGKLWRAELAGGSPLLLTDVPTLGEGAWTDDGRLIVGIRRFSLFQLPASGGALSPLLTLDASKGEIEHLNPSVLPGGRVLYFTGTGTNAAFPGNTTQRVQLPSDARVFHARGGEGKDYLLWRRGDGLAAQEFNPSTLTPLGEPHTIASPLADGQDITEASASATGVLLYRSEAGLRQFIRLNRSGQSMGAVGESAEFRDLQFRLSPDGQRVAVIRGRDFWLLDTNRGLLSRLTSDPGLNLSAVWSPDSRTIVYAKGNTLARREIGAGGAEEPLTQSETAQYPEDWSRDGRSILYRERTSEGSDLWVLSVTPDGRLVPGASPRPYLRTRSSESMARFSPDASPRWVAYVSDESGRREVYVQPFPEPGERTQISTHGGVDPRWAPGGSEIFYVAGDGNLTVARLTMTGGKVTVGTEQVLFPFPDPDASTGYEIAPDGTSVLVLVPREQASEPLQVIVNWPALLRDERTSR